MSQYPPIPLGARGFELGYHATSRMVRARDDLMAACIAAPDDAALWRVYADRLLEADDPRGELIHLELGCAELPAKDARRNKLEKRIKLLIAEHRDRWLAAVTRLKLDRVDFALERGAVVAAIGPPSVIGKHATALVVAAPFLRRLELRPLYEKDLAVLAGTPLLARLRELHINTMSARRLVGWDALADLPELRTLVLEKLALGPSDLASVFTAPQLTALRVAGSLNRNCLAGFDSLRGPLRSLDIPFCHFGEPISAVVSRFRLERLLMPSNQLGSAGLAAMLNALGNIEEIDLSDNQIVGADVAKLLDAAPRIHTLELANNDIGDDTLELIARHPHMAGLRRLHVGSTKATDRGARALAASPNLANLQSLVLSSLTLAAATERALLASPHLANARLYVGSRFLKRER